MDEPVFHQLSIDRIGHLNLDAEHAASLLRRFLTAADASSSSARRRKSTKTRCFSPQRRDAIILAQPVSSSGATRPRARAHSDIFHPELA
jgi:hypothetical protein